MARIRSIKPEFFTSEAVSALPLSARLTFIGLWTYVDDNGVGLDNDRLILAAVYPLEGDPLETLRRVSDDLRSLSGAGLIQRYECDGKRLLFIRSWDEHQKVSHPGKARYARPLTCENTDPPETLRKPSGESPAILRPEQGAGSREQGAGKRARPPAAEPPSFAEFWSVYPLRKGRGGAVSAYVRALRKAGADVILDGARRYRNDPGREDAFTKHPATWLNQECWADEPTPLRRPSNQTADEADLSWHVRRGLGTA